MLLCCHLSEDSLSEMGKGEYGEIVGETFFGLRRPIVTK
jgi:hypothetical protein